MIDQAHLDRMAVIWRDRPPSGKFILHRIPLDHICEKHGLVTKWHECHWERDKKDRPLVVPILKRR